MSQPRAQEKLRDTERGKLGPVKKETARSRHRTCGVKPGVLGAFAFVIHLK